MFSECLPAVQVWALSKILSNPYFFFYPITLRKYGSSTLESFPQIGDHQFAWILWYIWKERNKKVFNSMDIDPMDTIKLAETKSLLWAEARVSVIQKVVQK